MNNLLTDFADNILTARISRPKALNALNAEVFDELDELIQKLYRDDQIRGLILTGDGDKAFVAGADIKELAVMSQQQALKMAKRGQSLFKKIENCPKPVIAAVNGFALGGGCELAMACHIRLASENAKFGQPEINLGIIPGYGGTQRLTQLVGRGKTLELLLTADQISAQEGKALGLVNQVVATREELMNLATSMMKKIVSKSPIAIANIIKSVNDGFAFEIAGYAAEAELFAACAATEDFKEGASAFIEKRPPVFKGM